MNLAIKKTIVFYFALATPGGVLFKNRTAGTPKTAFALLVWGYPPSILARGLSLIWPETGPRTLFWDPIGQNRRGKLGKIGQLPRF